MVGSIRLATVSVVMLSTLAVSGCASVTATQAGPLEIGDAEVVPDRSVCVAEVPAHGAVWFGERVTNRSDHDATILSIEAVETEGLDITSIEGRVMSTSDPHFLSFSEESRADPVFSRALANLREVDGQVVRSGEALGIVIETNLLAATGSVRNIKITYESEDQTYSSISATTLKVSSSQCAE